MARYTRASVYVYDAMRCDNHDGDSTASASTIMDATITAGNIRALERTTSEVGWGGAEYRGVAHIRYHNVSDTNCNRRSRVTLPKLAHSIYYLTQAYVHALWAVTVGRCRPGSRKHRGWGARRGRTRRAPRLARRGRGPTKR